MSYNSYNSDNEVSHTYQSEQYRYESPHRKSRKSKKSRYISSYDNENMKDYYESLPQDHARYEEFSRKSKKKKRSRSKSVKHHKKYRSRSRGYKRYDDRSANRYREDSSSNYYAKDTEEIQAKLTDDEKDARTINVWQLSNRVKTSDLEKFFGRVGKLCVVKLIMDPRTGKSRGVAYIQFRNMESVDNALDLSGEKLLGVPIQIRTVSSEKCRAAEASMGLAGITTKVLTKLGITNLHPRISEENVEKLFSSFGALKDVKLTKNVDPQSPNSALVVFYKGESAKSALEAMNNYDVGGFPIKITPVTDNGVKVASNEEGMTMNKSDRMDLMAKLSAGSGVHNSPTISVKSPCFKLSNMFELREIIEDEELIDEIYEDVLDECNKHGGALHIHVDRQENTGSVYVKCPSAHIAEMCFKNLDGRSFDGRIIKAEFLRLPDYTQKFPNSATAIRLLKK